MLKFKTYNGESLYNVEVSYKIDGVRAHKTEHGIVSRSGKPLYNIQMGYKVAEIFTGSWENTISRVKTMDSHPVEAEFIYNLDPIDQRLLIGNFEFINKETVEDLFNKAKTKGYEGLVIKSGEILYKVKETQTYDVLVEGVTEGRGRNKGRLGALVTPMGKVGTGFTDSQRDDYFKYLNKIVEVECMELTSSGKFRHPRFIRVREDKC